MLLVRDAPVILPICSGILAIIGAQSTEDGRDGSGNVADIHIRIVFCNGATVRRGNDRIMFDNPMELRTY